MVSTNMSLTLDSEELEYQHFAQVAQGFRELLADVEVEVTNAPAATAEWVVVSDPTLSLTVTPNGVSGEQLAEIARRTWDVLNQVRHAFQEDNLSGVIASRKRRTAINRITKPLENEEVRITVVVGEREPIVLDGPAGGRRVAREPYIDEWSSLDGIVDLLSIRPPRPFFGLRENNTQRIVKVYFSEDQFLMAQQTIGRLVEITGLTRFRMDGTPTSVRELQSVYMYPDPVSDTDSEIDALVSSVPSLLNELSIEEYMDELRGRYDE